MGVIATRAEFAAALSTARAERALSLRQVAKEVGLPVSTLQGWFDGKHLPTIALQPHLIKLVWVLGIGDDEDWPAVLTRLRSGSTVGANPYAGIQPYGVNDAARFYGRRRVLDDLVAAIERVQTAKTAKIVAVVGVSGAGKTSLLNAGLVGHECSPNGRLARFATAILPISEVAGWQPPPHGEVLLVVDQAEDLRLLDENQREGTLAMLAALPTNVTCVLSMMADAFGFALSDERLHSALMAPVLVGALSDEEFEEIARKPAEDSGRVVDDALVALLLRDLHRYGQPAASILPLLSTALWSAWDAAEGGTVKVADYIAEGGLWGGLERLAENIYQGATADEQRYIRSLMISLVQVTSDGIERRMVELAAIPEEELALAEALLEARLLTLQGNTLAISHSALLVHWKRLDGWVDEERDHLLFRRRLGKAAEVWEEANRDPLALIPIEALVFDRSTQHNVALTPLERDFFEASLERAEQLTRESQREIRRLRRRNGVITTLAVLSIAAVLLTVLQLAQIQRVTSEAASARAQAQSRQIAMVAEGMRATDPNVAAQLSLAALKTSPTEEAQASVLKSAGLGAPQRITGTAGPSQVVASADGALLIRALASGEVTGWRQADFAKPAFQFSVGDGQLSGLAYGTWQGDDLVAVAGGGTASIWDVSGEPRRITEVAAAMGDKVAANAVAIGGAVVYFGLFDGTIARYNLATGQLEPALRFDPNVAATALAVTADGRTLVAAGGGQVALWVDGVEQPRLRPGADVTRVAFSPGGQRLLLGGSGGFAQLLGNSDGTWTTLADLSVDHKAVHSVALTDTSVAIGYWGGTVNLFDQTGQRQGSLTEPATVSGVALVGDRLVTAGLDGVLRIWQQRYSGLLVEGSNRHSGSELQQYVVLRGDDGTISAFDSHSGEAVASVGTGDALETGAVLVAEDVLTVSIGEGKLRTWDLTQSAQPVDSQVGTSSVLRFAGSSDPTLALSAERLAGHVDVIRRTGLVWETTDALPIESAQAMAWHPREHFVAAISAHTQTLAIFDLTGEKHQLLGQVAIPDQDAVVSLKWSPTLDRIYLGTDGGAVFEVDVMDLAKPTISQRHYVGSGVASLAISADGQQLAAGLADGRIWVWQTQADQLHTSHVLRPGLGPVTDLQLHDEAMVFITDDSGVYSWPLDVAAAREDLCATLGVALSPQEWKLLVPDADPVDGCS